MSIRKNNIRRSFLVILGALLCACRPDAQTSPADSPARSSGIDKPVIYTVNYPLKYFAERIGGEAIQAAFPAPTGEDPADWQPDPETIVAYQKADLILLNGADYAQWTATSVLPQSKLVDTSQSFKDRYVVVENAVTHSHGPGGEHSHAGIASTTWLDFTLAVEQARAIKDALVKLRPEKKAIFEDGFASLEKDLLSLDEDIKRLVAKHPDRPLIGSHPVYQYLARRYSLNLKSLHWEPDEMPDADSWSALQTLRKTHVAKWLLWEGQPTSGADRKLKDLGVGSVVFSPCGNVPESGDFLSVMRENVKGLGRVFAK